MYAGSRLKPLTSGKAPPDRPAFQPYWGKPAVRNERGDRGNVGIIRSPVRASILPNKAVPTGVGFECRKRNRAATGKLSAHALGLAVDVAGFELASGGRLFVTESQDSPKVTLLSALRRASCGWFTTILGPGTDAMHADHWHLDIQQHGSSASYRICQ